MRDLKRKKKIITCSVLLFSLLSITLFTNFNFEPPFYKDDTNKDDFVNVLKTSDSLPFFNGVGDEINITLHQSYTNNSFNTALSPSDPNNNSFFLPCPTDLTFNSSFTNVSINNINAPNKTLNLELGTTSSDQISWDLLSYSFRIRTTCLIQNLSIYLAESGGSGGVVDVKLFIYNTTWNGAQLRIEPDTDTGVIDITESVPDEDAGQWYNYTINKELDAANTYNNTFFVYIYQNTNPAVARAYYHYETGSTTDNLITYRDSGGGWQEIARDISSQIILGFTDNTPIPSDINLRVNDTIVSDIGTTNSGYWESTDVNSSVSGELHYVVSADWWDVTCNVSQVQINYTKMDLRADSSFEVLGNGQDVLWNVTRNGGLNYFGTDFNNYRINFTVPATWHDSSIKVFNGSDEWSINKRLLGNGYREIEVPNAINGTFWFLNATSSNLLTNIEKYIDITPADTFNYTDLVHFNGTFSSSISDGNINLSVYNPLALNDYLNYTFVNSSFGSGTEIYFGDWDISNNITKYGEFRILTQWNNGTDAGFFRDNITILAETNLLINQPPQNTIFDSSNIFNVTVFFNDTGLDTGINADNFSYHIEGGPVRTDNITNFGNGYYNITIDCNDSDFNGYGLKSLEFSANKHYYNNQTKSIQITIYGETELLILKPIDNALFDSGELFNITVLYNDTVKDIGINDATIEYRLDPTASFKSDNIFPIGNGYYNITIDCNDTDFTDYGPNTIVVNASKQFYYNQSSSLNLRLLGETSLTILNPIDLTVFNSSETFNVTIHYNNTVKNQGIDSATIEYQLEPSASYKSSNIVPLGNGYYNISIDCNDTDFTDYGLKNIKINASKQYYYNRSKTVQIIIHGETELTILNPLDLTVFNSGDIFNMTVFYNDTILDLGIEADVISYKIGAGSIRTTENITYIGNGYYNITVSCNDTDFNYGLNTIVVNTTKHYYNNQSESVSITILGETEATILYPLNNAIFDSGDTFNITIFYNDFVKDLGIAGAIINYSLDGGITYRQDNVNYIGQGKYNITISASDSDFNSYGAKTIIVNSSKQYYYNQSNPITINLLGETSLSATLIPDQLYYTAAESFSISVYYRDIVKGLGIVGADVSVEVDGTIYYPFISDNADGYYNITIDCSDLIFSNYKLFSIRVNVSLVNYYNQSTTLNTLIVGNETLFVLAPTSGAVFIDGQSFDIIVEYNDSIRDVGIDGATIEYSLDGGITYRQDNVTYIGNGRYSIRINVNDTDFTQYGFVDIYIDASKQFYENRSATYTFHRQITTQITPLNVIDLGSIMKGLNVSYTFNYSDTTGKPIQEVLWSLLSSPVGFTAFLENLGNGNYTMHLDTTNVLVTGSAYDYEFNIYATGNETQIIKLTVNVLIIRTEVIDVSSIPEIARNSGLNQSVRFYFNDTTNNLPVLNVITINIVVKNYATGTPFNDGEFWLFDPFSNGTYILDITMGTRISGWYTLEINASKFPNYEISLFNITFYYRGNYTTVNINSISDPGAEGLLTPVGNNYSAFIERNIYVDFTLTDNEFGNNLITGSANSYIITYYKISNMSIQGIITHGLVFDANTDSYKGYLTTSSLTVGTYALNITIIKTNYENSLFSFNLIIKSRFNINISVVDQPNSVIAGNSFFVTLKAEYYNGTDWLPLVDANMILTPFFNALASTPITITTNDMGIVIFEITIRSDATNMTLLIEIQINYYHLADTLQISDISVIPPSPGLSFEDLLPYIVIIGAVVAVAGGSLAVYRGVVVPKKREKQRILTEVKTIFDDAINLEHILVLYKGTGTCIFFKSYGSEQIDPELIGGFLSAVSSFGKEMATQEALNEISYGDKMLLLADGALIRVALVLGKKGSLILRRHLKAFIDRFEKTYNDVLPNWRGQLNPFRNSGIIVDELLNTSIILPHQISYDFSSVKELKNTHSREVLKVAQSCCEEAEREFFFIATLLTEVADRTNKDTAEIFIGIKELRDKKILIPIEISAIEAQPISQQEINLIKQKVMALANLTTEEKQKLVDDLAHLGPVEREAYLSSLTEQQEIVTAPIKTTVGDLSVDNQKSAKKGIKELLKRAKIAKNKKDYLKAVEIYQGAATFASNWELTTEFLKIQETIRKTRIEDLNIKKTNLENEARRAVKENNYLEAATKYKYASKMASEIFKLGVTEMTKEVKRLTNKANEYEKMK